MPLLVVDASVVAKWVFPEVGSEAARRVLDRYAAGLVDLLAPDVIVPELGNITWKKWVLLGQLTEREALEALRLIEALNFRCLRSLAERVSLARCTDAAFRKLKAVLQEWFPAT